MTAGIIGSYLGRWLTNKYGPKIFDKLGVPRLSPKKIEEYKSKSYPKYFSYIYGSYFFLFMCSVLSFTMLSIFTFEKIQYLLYGSNSLYFAVNNSDVFFGLLNIFGLIFVFGVLISSIYYFLGSKLFRDYFTYQSIKYGWDFEAIPSMRLYITVGILYYILMSPLIYFSLKDYTALFTDKIVQNRFFTLSEASFPIDTINDVTFNAKEYSSKGGYANPTAYVNFKNGHKIELGKHLVQFKQVAKDLDIPIIINPPSNFAIQVTSTTCEKAQEEFYSIFELDTPIQPHSSNLICF